MQDFKQDQIQNHSETTFRASESKSIAKSNNSDKSLSDYKSKDSPIAKSKVSTKISMIESKGGQDLSDIVRSIKINFLVRYRMPE
jgi:hypothetical protein